MTGPLSRNPYDGRRHVLSWLVFRIAERFPGRDIRVPFGRGTWRVDEDSQSAQSWR